MGSPLVRQAVTAADYDLVADLFREYADYLPFALDYQDFDTELGQLATDYGPPHGAAFIAVQGTTPVGVVAIRRLPDTNAELKRMYLRPDVRGHGTGRLLANHAIAAARRSGSGHLVLDTVVSLMPAANRLYESLGFVDIPPYCYNPFADARFMALDLMQWPGGAPVGVVLAGGESRRMGDDKQLLSVGGVSMFDHVTGALEHAGLQVVASGATPEPDRADRQWLADPDGVRGPVAGLLSALRRFPGSPIVLAGTDQPHIRPETVRVLLEVPGSAVSAIVDDHRQPLPAVYRDDCLPVVERLVTENPAPSLQDVLDTAGAVEIPPSAWQSWGEDGRTWRSVDTPDHLESVRHSWPDVPDDAR